MARVIFWLRRDLRLTDNTAFYQTKRQTRDIIPAYILSPWKKRHAWTGSNRQLFLCGCLEHLSESLVQAGSRLIIRAGEPVETLILLARESKADAIAYNRLYDPFDIALEKRLQAAAAQEGLKLHAHHDISIHSPGALLNQSGQPFRVFSPFARAWHKLAKPACLPRVTNLQAPPDLRSLPVPTLKFWDLTPEAQVVEAGEKAAAGRLRRFLTRQVFSYGAKRNFPSAAGTSRLSQDLRHGTLSPRTIYHACHEAAGECTAAQRTSLNSFVNEIVWREFYLQILWHHPEVLDQDFNPEFTKLRWDRNEGAFQKWAAGQTGFRLVDAGMRELNSTGFMHNRYA
jgi:deoxyribodipyrimidine photo-lyase